MIKQFKIDIKPCKHKNNTKTFWLNKQITLKFHINSKKYPKDIDHLERLQRLATRMVKGCRGLSYEDRLEKLSLFSLACRRLRVGLILAYNLSNGSFDLPIEEFFTRSQWSSLRGHILKLHHRRFRLNPRKGAFSVRIVEPWNKLPAFAVGPPSVDVFKSRLDAGALLCDLISPHTPIQWPFSGFSSKTAFCNQ